MYDLHIHSVYSDGKAKIDEIARKAKERGLKVIAIVDHSIEHEKGLTTRKAKLRQIEIEKAMDKYNIEILSGIECGILENGKIEKPDFEFDIIIASIHSYLPSKEYYERIFKCIENEEIDILGHLHAKMFSLNGRDEEKEHKLVDMLIESGVALEINSYHNSPPLDFLLLCKESKINYSIGSDSHSIERVGDIKWAEERAKILKKGRNFLRRKKLRR